MKTRWGRIELRPLAIGSSFRWGIALLIVAVALVLAAAAPELWARRHQTEIPFSIARMIIEFNSSANEGVGDIGVQVLIDGEPWRSLKIKSPDGKEILDVKASRSLRNQGLTEFFFESSEPSLDEVPLADFLARFPEGRYEFEGKTIDGLDIEGEAVFTHVIPAGPKIVAPEVDAKIDPAKPLVIEWEAVTKTIDDSDVKIVAYQVIVERADNALLGAVRRNFDIKLAATTDPVQRVTVPPQFLEPGTEYKFEILAIEQGGNQTITEGGPFTTTK